ncbi:MAG: adenine deaminase [Candidatus Korarchaeota archaeon]
MIDEWIDGALGTTKPDLVLKNCTIVDVHTLSTYEGDIAIMDEHIVGIGNYSGKKEIDVKGAYVSPGFIDAHIHLESVMVEPSEFVRIASPHGTTTIIADPHEITNVLGLEGIRYMLDATKGLPIYTYIMIPSCVPATPMETSGAELEAYMIEYLIEQKRIIGLAEVMNYPAVINANQSILEKIGAVEQHPIDGHAPDLRGKLLSAYASVGIRSDHECSNPEEAMEKIRKGMFVMIREGSAARNLVDLISVVTPKNHEFFMFATDDTHPHDLLKRGHIDHLVRLAISNGMDPLIALKIAGHNAARYFGIERIGAVAPGYIADLVVIENLNNINVVMTFKRGRLVAKDGQLVEPIAKKEVKIRSSMNVRDFNMDKLKVVAKGERIRVIGVIPGQLITKSLVMNARIKDGYVVPDVERDILKIAVVERHRATGNVGVGFIHGMGIKEGAMATTIAHDSHNIICVGTSDEYMNKAITEVIRIGGGIVLCTDKNIMELPLPIAGLISNLKIEEVADRFNKIVETAHAIGSRLSDPFMTLSFMALPVIPELKITDKGLFDVTDFKFANLFI